VELTVAENVPARHEVQSLAEAAEYLPTAQAPVTADRPVVAQYEPAEQELQLVEPVLAA